MTRNRDLANLGDNSSALENQGLTLISTTTFSAVTSHSVNNVFSSTYRNYRVVINLNLSASNGINFRLRASGSDDSTSNYVFASVGYRSNNATSSDYSAGNQTSLQNFMYCYTAGTDLISTIDIMNPNLTIPTYVTGSGPRYDTANVIYSMFVTARHNVSSAFTGFTLFSTSNFTGDVSVYGYKK